MIPRTLAPILERRAAEFPVVFLTGPRQSGKTTLARSAFPGFEYLSLEELSTRRNALEDPRGFLRRLEDSPGAILDEVQNAPDLFSYIQGFVDEGRGGPLILTGSQQFLLSERIAQSLAGRASVLELLPFSVAELSLRPGREPSHFPDSAGKNATPPAVRRDDLLLMGCFPPIHDRSLAADPWLDSYVRTYVERDVRLVSGVGDLDAFTRFIGICAGRTGGLLNLSSLGSDAGVSHVTAKKWISILRASYVIDLVHPHHENFSKRLIRSPKLYFLDSGLLCFLLGIRTVEHLAIHPLRGVVFESFVFSELRKVFLHHGERARIYFWRDSRGREVDFLLDLGLRRIPIEVKASETLPSDAFNGLDWYLGLSGDAGGMVITGGERVFLRGAHTVLPWFAVS